MNPQFNSKVHVLDPIISNALMGDTHRDFHLKKREVMAYRLIFLAFGIFFTAISFYLMMKTANWKYSLLFGYGVSVKTTLAFCTAILAFGSLWIGCRMRTEHELMRDMQKKAITELKKLYKQRRAPLPLISASIKEAKRDRDLRLMYEDSLESIQNWCKEIHVKLDYLENDVFFNQATKLKAKIDWLKTLKLQLQEVLDSFESAVI